MDTNIPAFPEAEPNATDIPQSVIDEELFEAYLSARLTQALDALDRAREELAAQPDDFSRANQVMRRVHDLRELRGQLEMQRARLNAARSAAGLEAANDEPQATVQATPSDAFRASQSQQAEKIIEALAAQPRTCPLCQALLQPNSAQCHCGYTVDAEAGSANPDTKTQTATQSPAS
jgi:hypothetical protein